jgi:hypothetical protein
MRALTVEELGFVSGGGTPLAQQAEQALYDRIRDALDAMGLNGDRIMTSGTGFSVFSGGGPRGGVAAAISNWAKGLIGTVWAGDGLAIGASRNSDGSINIGVGFGYGFSLSSSAIKDQTIQGDLGISRQNGRWTLGGSLLIWIGASTDAENTAYWDQLFGR